MTSDILSLMAQSALGASAAMLLVMLARKRVLAAFGARTAYALWLLVPIAMVASLLPADFVVREPVERNLSRAVTQPTSDQISTGVHATDMETAAPVARTETQSSFQLPEVPTPLLFALWIAGTGVSLGALAIGQRRFMKRHGLKPGLGKSRVARHADVGPAVLGFLHPRIVVPHDFRDAYSPLERKLILAHEQAHIRAGDMQTNALAIAIRSLNWFNPLAYVAYGMFRTDQELACDERVMRQFGKHRRAYAETLLKSQLMGERAPLGCSWFGDTRHPLKDRVARLARRELSPVRRMAGLGLLLGATSLTGVAAWATLATQVVYLDGGKASPVALDTFVSAETDMGGDSEQVDPLKEAQGAALVDAILERRRDHAEAFLKAGVDVNYHRKGDGTPLSVAAMIGDREMVDLLIKAGADINKVAPGDGTPLLVAARSGDREMVETLLKAGADVNAYSPGDGTALIAAARSRDKEMVELLLEAGAKVNQIAPGDGTALLAAIDSDSPAIMEVLLEGGADLDMVAPGDGTAMTAAVQRRATKVVDQLIKLGASVNKAAPGEGTPLLVAARSGDIGMVEKLLKAGAEVNKAAPGDGNALIMAAAIGDLAMVKRLVDADADVNAFVLGDETPLIAASRGGHMDVVEYLTSKGADVNARVRTGDNYYKSRNKSEYRTPLGQALRYEHGDIAEYLRRKGATEPTEPEDR